MQCSVENCDREVHGKGYCMKHYQVFRKHGCIPHVRKQSLNEIVLYSDYAEIIIYNNKNKEKCRTKISLDKIDLVKDIRWGYCNGYIENKKVGKLHRFILGVTDPKLDIDHVNHDTLDNRTDKLRILTRSQNNMNKECKGIYFHKIAKKWNSRITIDKKTISLGYFDLEKEAIQARKEAEEKYFGEYRFKGEFDNV